MSFSSELKGDLVKLRVKGAPLRRAVFYGLVQSCGQLCITRGGLLVRLKTESLPVARYAASLAGGLYGLDARLELAQRAHRACPLSVVSLSGEALEKALAESGALARGENGAVLVRRVPEAVQNSDEARRAFLRGCFLGCGSCADPARAYHLELVCENAELARCLTELAAGYEIQARIAARKGRFAVYIRGDAVSAFLALIGAPTAALALESTRVEKDLRNYVNRTSNCETANIGKAVDAAIAQLDAIETIEARMSLEELPQPLYEAARLRLSAPMASLQELADMAEIGKSGMNHRFQRLIAIAKELSDEAF